LTGLIAEILRWEVLNLGRSLQYSEFGYVERVQSALLLTSTIILIFSARAATSLRQLAVCMALVFCIMLIRENDQVLELVFPHGIWKYFAAIPALIGIVYFRKNRKAITSQLIVYSHTASFGVMLSGFAVLVFSRLFGRTSYWQSVMGEEYMRVVKNAAEEGVELLGLTLILLAVIQFATLGKPAVE
jgi:hypothetical protein